MAKSTSQSPAAAAAGGQPGGEVERVRAAEPQGAERTRSRPVYVPRVDIVETPEALEILADMPGVTKDSLDITLEQRVLRIYGRADVSIPDSVGPLYLEYQPGDYERAFTLSEAVDANGIEARVRNGVLQLRLPKAGPAKAQKIEVRAD
jgi:HSP20 family protein